MGGRPNPIGRLAFFLVLGALLAGEAPPSARAADNISEQEAHSIGVAAYVYFYSLVTMEVTRKQLTNVAKPEGIHTPMNTFANLPAFPTAAMRAVVRPNFDTLYSSAWLDLTKEPMIVSAPDTHGRYYLLPMLDMWTDVFASPGWRTTGTQAENLPLCRRAGAARCRPASTASTHRRRMYGLSAALRPTDLRTMKRSTRYKPDTKSRRSRGWGRTAEPVVGGTVDPAIDMKTPPKTTVDTMPAGKFFAYAAEIMKLQSPHITDQPILAQMQADRDRTRQEF